MSTFCEKLVTFSSEVAGPDARGRACSLRGAGAVGTLLGFHLRLALPTLPITLLLKDTLAKDRFLASTPPRSAGKLRVELASRLRAPEAAEAEPEEAGGFEVETVFEGTGSDRIDSLITLVKCVSTLDAMQALAPRLDERSTVTLLQNGMGVRELLEDEVFWDEKRRPRFIVGSTTLGARAKVSVLLLDLQRRALTLERTSRLLST